MKLFLSIVIHTANILGIFTDPFEFEGDYGPEVNPTRQKVFELVVSRNDTEYGPTLGQLVTPELLEEIKKKQSALEFPDTDFVDILNFIQRHQDKKVFYFLRNNPPQLMHLDKPLRDAPAREGRTFSLPILGSTEPLQGSSSLELKKNLIEAVFTKETFALTKPRQPVADWEAFCSPLGQVFYYWMYHSLNLELVSADPEMIPQINKVKEIFARTLGDPTARANALKDKLLTADSGVLFTQESDALVPQILTQDGTYYPVDRQNPQDGTFVFLRSDQWEPNYEIVPIEGYSGFDKGLMNVILATRKDSGQKFLLAACHGHSTKPEDGRLQITLVMEKFHQLSDGNLQLFIGTDANTKSEEDVRLFEEHLHRLGLIATQVGPTTVKKRMVTTQHSKAGRLAIDQEDYLITLSPESGGQFHFNHVTVGFSEGKADITQALPNIHNPSDHYPVGATMTTR